MLTRRGAQDGPDARPRDGAAEIAARARGTPRVAGRLLRRVRDFAAPRAGVIDAPAAARASPGWRWTSWGWIPWTAATCAPSSTTTAAARLGVETLAYAIAEARDAVEDVIEPFLLQQGFIQRTPRGRVACAKACDAPRPDPTRRKSRRRADFSKSSPPLPTTWGEVRVRGRRGERRERSRDASSPERPLTSLSPRTGRGISALPSPNLPPQSGERLSPQIGMLAAAGRQNHIADAPQISRKSRCSRSG